MSDPADHGRMPILSRFLRRRPSQERSRALVAAVVTAFEEILARAEVDDDVTVDAVLDRAGVGMSSFYQYFGDKRSLLGAFVGHLTERNFRRLVAALDAAEHPTLQKVVEHVAAEVVATYCARPAVTRAAVAMIGRLGLLREVSLERDRFASELTRVAQRYYPAAAHEELARSLRVVSDLVIGLVVSEVERSAAPDTGRLRRDLEWVAMAYLTDRHGPPTVLQPS